jgi:hypothetical protein
MPKWFSHPNPGLRASTVIRAGQSLDSLDRAKALQLALESINANRKLYFMAEHFDEGLNTMHSFYEYAIDTLLQTKHVQISQATHSPPWYFQELALKQPVSERSADSTQWLYANASYPILLSDPHRSFEKAKQLAMREIAYKTHLKVQGTQWEASGFAGDLFFIKSRVIFEYIEVVERFVLDGKAHVHVRVRKERVLAY